MTLEELIAQHRADSKDLSNPPLCSAGDVTLWLNEAEEEAAIRASLIHEADNADICQIVVTAGVATYPVSALVLEITRAVFTPTGTTRPIVLDLKDRVELDRVRPDWRTRTEEPRALIQNDTNVRFGCLPSTDGVLQIECYRLPLEKMEDNEDAPEIGQVHHRNLIHWSLYRGYSRPDSDFHNVDGAAKALADFERIFGLRIDANLRRSFQANTPMHNKAYW